MAEAKMTPREQQCISECIYKHWSSSQDDSQEREQKYEQCLTDCNVCS
ncbi:MAG: hypothetical protein P8X55_01475 [Desulfosarcinaceae bacterium]